MESESPPEPELELEAPGTLELEPFAGLEPAAAEQEPELETETLELESPSGPEPVATAPLPEEEPAALELEPLSGGEQPGAMAQVTEDEPDALELEPLSGPIVPSVAAAAESETESAALELEVFSREPLEEQGTGAAEAGPKARAAVDEPAIEVFGRPKREGPPRTTKGERSAFEEIELEPTAFAATEPEAESDEESPFEIFTRDPRGAEAPTGVRRQDRGESSGYREIELEPAASPESATPETDDTDSAATGLEEELPRVGTMREIDLAPQAEMEIPPYPEGPAVPAAAEQQPLELSPPAPAPYEAPYFPVEELLSGEFEREAPLIEPPPAVATVPAPPAPEPPQPGSEVHDGTEAPDFLEESAAVETSAQVFEVPREEMAEEATEEAAEETREETQEAGQGGEEAEEAAGPAPRGVFDTETLAAIYVSQGFHARAAEIYRRLVDQYPGDEKLRRKLDEVLARERGEQRTAEPRAGADDEKIRRLQVLLDAFRGGRQ